MATTVSRVPTRRFGRTELDMPVLTCGGMRAQSKWGDEAEGEIPRENQENFEAIVHHAMDRGINHFETARGYGTSEYQFGRVLPTLPRDEIIVQTKVSPHEDPKVFLENVEKSYRNMGLEMLDLVSVHGLNTQELIDMSLRKGGMVDVLRKLQREGRVRFIGFSTHGLTPTIVKAIQTGEFDYVNVHWYYVYDPITWPAVQAAAEQDMGVFIIRRLGGWLVEGDSAVERYSRRDPRYGDPTAVDLRAWPGFG